RLHSIIKIIVQTITCVALSGRKQRMTITIDRRPQTENAPVLNCDLFDFVMDYDFLNFLNHCLHSIIKIIVQTIAHKRKTLPFTTRFFVYYGNGVL
ncbi:MAG: hypothetical protein LBG58_15265, partial [Planctomycetaceae bacterium]|nr:hypothetical protein [Planctomycetaceae bacterium]